MPNDRVLNVPDGRTVRVRVRAPAEPTGHVAVLFPGRGYSCEMPLLFYTQDVLVARGAEVHAVLSDYNDALYRGITAEALAEVDRRLHADAAVVLDDVLRRGAVERVTLIGKSLGSRVVAAQMDRPHPLLECCDFAFDAVAHTPLLHYDEELARYAAFEGRALYTIGTADPVYDADRLDVIDQASRSVIHVAPGADHGFQVPGDVGASAAAVAGAALAVDRFVADAH